MNSILPPLLAALMVMAAGMPTVFGQSFSSGSDGSDGSLEILSGATVLDLPEDGIFHFTRVHIAAGAVLRFNRNAANTPVHILASDDVEILGTIDISGQRGTSLRGGFGGPGGFDGGMPGIAGALPGPGFGPGGGRGATSATTNDGVSSGSFGTRGSGSASGPVYGSQLLMPLIGGSGGGGIRNLGGVGGGGAILVASSTRIQLGGQIDASTPGSNSGNGSGGAIRLLAPMIEGNGLLNVNGGPGGAGRIRIDLIDRRNFQLRLSPANDLVNTISDYMVVFPPSVPTLSIIEAAGEAIPAGSVDPVAVKLPFNDSGNRSVLVQLEGFNQVVPVTVALLPDSGPPAYYTADVDNTAAGPVQHRFNVTFPPNVWTRVQAWAR